MERKVFVRNPFMEINFKILLNFEMKNFKFPMENRENWKYNNDAN